MWMMRRNWPAKAFILSVMTLCAAPSLEAAQYAELTESRVTELAAIIPTNPKGLGPNCADRASWSEPALTRRLVEVTAAADALLKQDFPQWSDEAYLEYAASGKRPKGEQMMNARKAWLMPLVLAECTEGKSRYLPTLDKVLLELSNQPSWTWPAHDKSLRNFRNRNYEVDLFAADTAHDLAQTLYMLGDRLPTTTRSQVAAALEQRIFAPMRRSFARGSKDHWWLQANHNWNAVCLKGVVGAALAAAPDRRDRALFAAAGEHYIKNYIAGFPNDGYSLEGPSYWNYGFSHFVGLRELLAQATQGGVDLFSSEKIRAIALYGYRIEMAPDVIAAFGDAPRTTKIDGLTRAYVNAAFELGAPHRLQDLPIRPREKANAAVIVDAVTALFVQPAPTHGGGATATVDLASYFPDVGVLISRPAGVGRLGASIKAGGNGNHSHNDVGSYSIALGAQQPTGDPGVTVYSSKTFGPERYSIRAINSFGHPVPVVAGALQLNAMQATPKVTETRLSEQSSGISIDLKSAYAVEALTSLSRTMRHQRTGAEMVMIEDRVVFSRPETFEVALIVHGDWRDRGDGSIEIRQTGERLITQIEASTRYDLVVENIDEEGLKFTRIGIRLFGKVKEGFVRQTFSPG